MISPTITPIQTHFDGRYFRSRLEARTAYFFKELKIEYSYEPEGYDLGKVKYLPDFFLPNVFVRDTLTKGWFIEVKPFGQYNAPLDLLCSEGNFHGLLMAGDNVRHNNHIQLGEFMDDGMTFRTCEDCGLVKIGHGVLHATCQKCGGYCNDKPAELAAIEAKSARFQKK